MKFKHLLPILYFFFFRQSVGQIALPLLNDQQSVLFNGAGQIGVSIPSDIPSGYYYNPAILGYTALRNHVSPFYSSGKLEVSFSPELFNYSFGLNAGYNFIKNDRGLPLSLGLGFIHSNLDLDEGSRFFDEFNALSFGAGYNGFLFFSIGFSAKFYHSVHSDQPVEEEIYQTRTSGTAFDFGTLITVPFSKLLLNDVRISIDEKNFFKPSFDFSLGYSASNIGDQVYFIDPDEGSPLPRTARLGYTIDLGVNLSVNETLFNLVNYSFTGEAEESLAQRFHSGIEYKSLIGNFKVVKNLINLEGDGEMTVHKGHIFKLLETVYITSGNVNGYYYHMLKTKGIGISLNGLLKYYSAASENETIAFIADHFSLEYLSSSMTTFLNLKRNYNEFSISLRELMF